MIIGALSSMMSTGCYYDNEEELYGHLNPSCDSSNVTYSAVVSKIIQDNCLQCHSASANMGSVNLEGHTQAKSYADNGKLYGVISHSPGFSPMPKGGNKLSDCDVARIKKWIDAGAPND